MENLNIWIRFPKENEYENGLLCDVVANTFQEKIIRDSSVNRVNWLPAALRIKLCTAVRTDCQLDLESCLKADLICLSDHSLR